MRRLKVLAFLMPLIVAAVVFGGDKSANADDSSLQGAQSIAVARANAVKNSDRQAFLDTVDPQAPQSFKDAQAALYDGMHSLPYSKFEMNVTTEDSGDLASGLQLKGKYLGADVALPETRVTYRFGNYDDRDAVDTYWYTYVQRNDKWYVAGDSDASMIGLDSAKELWDNGALAVQSNERVLVITKAGAADRGADLLRSASDALNVFDTRWTIPWNDKIVVIDPGSAQEASAILNTQGNIADFAAFTTYTPLTDDGWTTTAPRVFAQDENLATESAGLQRDTLVHELTHYAESGLSGPFTPTWVHEGSAEWLRLAKPTALDPGIKNPSLPTSTDFTANKLETVSQAYKSAASATAFVDGLKGQQAPIDLFRAIGDRRLNVGSPAYNVDQAIQQVTGLNTQQLTNAWSAKYPK